VAGHPHLVGSATPKIIIIIIIIIFKKKALKLK
jgi:hypothetical protein